MEHDARTLLSQFEVLATEDARMAQDFIASLFSPHALDVLDGSLATRMHYAALPSVAVALLNYGAHVRIETQLSTWFGAIYPVEGECSVRTPHAQGTAGPDGALVLSATDQISVEFAADTTVMIVKMDRIAMERAAVQLASAPLVEPLRFNLVMDRNESGAKSFWRIAELMMRELSTAGSAVRHVPVSDHLEQALLQALLHCQGHRTVMQDDKRTLIAPRYIKLSESYMSTHADEPVTIDDLCKVAQVSRRTLFGGFRRYRGTSPTAYLKNIRLERVREELLRSSGSASVTEVATRWQFFQLGRFASEYRNQFGERPSETLRFARRNWQDVDLPR